MSSSRHRMIGKELAREVLHQGGEAVVCEAQLVEGLADGAVADLLRDGLQALGLSPVAESAVFPAVITIGLESGYDSAQVGESLEEAGYLLHYRSDYLLARNWLQICLMRRCTPLMVDELLRALSEALLACASSAHP